MVEVELIIYVLSREHMHMMIYWMHWLKLQLKLDSIHSDKLK